MNWVGLPEFPESAVCDDPDERSDNIMHSKRCGMTGAQPYGLLQRKWPLTEMSRIEVALEEWINNDKH